MRSLNLASDAENLAKNLDGEGDQMVSIAVNPTGHWSIVWPVFPPDTLPAGKPSGWKSVEVLIHGGVFKYRVSFRRWDGQTHQGWNLFNIDTLTLKYRDLLATMGGFDEVNEAEAMEAGDCIDCVKRTVRPVLIISRQEKRKVSNRRTSN
ncbi:hypothetical protein B0H14DRAFT_2756409 [Mycena olivaceomarginata]|nr:hypothetical protein B0H14DRAFT_2756409 [Mycena olivaceomarginata]